MSIRRKLEWTIIFGVLSAFTMWAGIAEGIAYAQPDSQFLNASLAAFHSSQLVSFEDEHGHFERDEFVCAITQDQLSQLQSDYTVKLEHRKDDGKTITVAIVTVGKHQDTKQLKSIIGGSVAGRCQHHHSHSLFYLFTIPTLS